MTQLYALRPGQLRKRLVLETPIDASDGGGGTTRSWQVATSFWGAVTPMAAGPGIDAEQPGGAIRYRVTCRHRTDIRPGHRLRNGTQTLSIDAVLDPDGTRRWTEARCHEHQP